MKLEVGMFVRTKVGEICKCLLIYIDDNNQTLNRFMNEWGNMIMFDEIKGEPSHNIIDLIEVGDYVNGKLVKQLPLCKNDFIYGEAVDGIKPVIGVVGTPIEDNKDGFVKSIVTKEQFEQMQYKVGE